MSALSAVVASRRVSRRARNRSPAASARAASAWGALKSLYSTLNALRGGPLSGGRPAAGAPPASRRQSRPPSRKASAGRIGLSWNSDTTAGTPKNWTGQEPAEPSSAPGTKERSSPRKIKAAASAPPRSDPSQALPNTNAASMPRASSSVGTKRNVASAGDSRAQSLDRKSVVEGTNDDRA